MGSVHAFVLWAAVFGAAPSENEVLVFSSTACPPCQRMSPIVAKLQREGYPFRKVDCSQGAALPQEATTYGVRSLPTFLVVSKGRVITRRTGLCSQEDLIALCNMLPKDSPPAAVADSQGGATGAQTETASTRSQQFASIDLAQAKAGSTARQSARDNRNRGNAAAGNGIASRSQTPRRQLRNSTGDPEGVRLGQPAELVEPQQELADSEVAQSELAADEAVDSRVASNDAGWEDERSQRENNSNGQVAAASNASPRRDIDLDDERTESMERRRTPASTPKPVANSGNRPSPAGRGIASLLPFGGSDNGDESVQKTRQRPKAIRGNIDQKRLPVAGAKLRSGPLAASVRVRVTDSNGTVQLGSGTIVASKPMETYILTCGHVFRGFKPGSTSVEVDFYDTGERESLTARVLYFNFTNSKPDLGILRVATDEAKPVAPIVGPEFAAVDGMPVVSVGCSAGDDPTVANTRILSVTRFKGNYVCAGAQPEGRSGGGLFSPDGKLIAVCSASDPNNGYGLYVSTPEVHRLLDEKQMGRFFRTDMNSDGNNVDSMVAAVAGDDRQLDADDYASGSGSDAEMSVSGSKTGTDLVHANGVGTGRGRRDQDSADVADSSSPGTEKRQYDDAEIVFVIRDRAQPAVPMNVMIINKATPELINRLKGELTNQATPTSLAKAGSVTDRSSSQSSPTTPSGSARDASQPETAGNAVTASEPQPRRYQRRR